MAILFIALLFGAVDRQLSPVFDDVSAHELMELRRRFDEAELEAIRQFDATVGGTSRVAVPLDHYRTQRATRETAGYAWTADQKRRAAAAWPIRQKRIAEAEEIFRTRSAEVLKRFGFTYDRIPPVRYRKWAGPAVYGFDGLRGDVPRDSRALLQELRRLWALSGQQWR